MNHWFWIENKTRPGKERDLYSCAPDTVIRCDIRYGWRNRRFHHEGIDPDAGFLSGLVTRAFQKPTTAVNGILKVHVILVGLTTVTLVAGIAELPAFVRYTFAPVLNPVPDRSVMVTRSVRFPETGTMAVITGAGAEETLIYRIFRMLLYPLELYTCNATEYFPGRV